LEVAAIGGAIVRPPTGDQVVLTVVGVTNYAGAKVMRDLTIADTHTYYVIAGSLLQPRSRTIRTSTTQMRLV
jgi:hypothetical protein